MMTTIERTGRTNESTSTTEFVEALEFELKFPDELNAVKPRWVIPMPRGTSVHVYDSYVPLGEATEHRPSGSHYECFLVSNKTGTLVRGPLLGNWYYGKNAFRTLHEIRYAMIALAEVLKVKKRSKRQVKTSEDEDDTCDL